MLLLSNVQHSKPAQAFYRSRLLAKRLILILVCAIALTVDQRASADDPDLVQARELVQKYCVDCHSSDAPEAHLDLSGFASREEISSQRHTWDKIRQRVELGEMPPASASSGEDDAMPIDLRQWFPTWLSQVFRDHARRQGIQPGPAPLRRLNRNQYGNTIRDLLGVHFDAGHELPADGAGGEGFDNSAETLFLSPMHGEKYLAAAKEALEYAARDKSARDRIFYDRQSSRSNRRSAKTNEDQTSPATNDADKELTAEQNATEILERFASRAFRRPVTADQLQRFMAIFRSAAAEGMKFDDAILYTCQAVLISPHFLFMLEPVGQPIVHTESQPVSQSEGQSESQSESQSEGQSEHQADGRPRPYLIDDYALAARLSYFLWDTMPDRELRSAAIAGGLNADSAIDVQVQRMLKSERLHEMSESFIGQWLGTRELGRQIKPDPVLYPKMIDEVADAYREEPVKLFEYVLRENRSLLELIASDYTFMNQDLLRAYKIDRKTIKEDVNQNLRKLPLPEGSVRGGIVTMAGPLTVSSFPNRTSPVLRGKWILEALLGTPPPPPPPDVPPLSEKDEDRTGKTLRQRLEIHRSNAVCASCHERLDPLGFALENFDPIGRWRDEENGIPVDAEGALITGKKIEGSAGLKKLLLERKDQFVRQLTTKLLGYALGRGLVDSDYAVIDSICEDLSDNEYQAQRLVSGIVRSVPFRYRQIELSQNEPASTIKPADIEVPRAAEMPSDKKIPADAKMPTEKVVPAETKKATDAPQPIEIKNPE